MRIKNKERFETFLAMIALTILMVIAIKNPTKGTISQWHDAIDEGTSWSEYTKEAM